MKKRALLCITLLLTVCMSLTVFAAGGAFTASPSLNQAPSALAATVVNDAGEVTEVKLVVSSFADRSTLSEESLAKIEESYEQIQAVTTVIELSEELAVLVEEQELNTETLAVSDLFDLDLEDFEAAEEGAPVTVTLELENAVNFVGLLHFRNGTWELVENASVSGNKLTFTVDSFSPFAIIVDTVEETPATGDLYVTVMLGLIAVGSAVAIGMLFKKSKAAAAN